jgi:DNA-binding transcriptional MerR regulator
MADKQVYRVHQFAKLVGRSPETVRDWDNSGRLPAQRTETNERFYTPHDVDRANDLIKKSRTR